MLIYVLLAIIIFIVFLITPNKIKDSYGYYIAFFTICFVGAFRTIDVGTDTYGYFLNFRGTTFDSSTWNYGTDFEIGFNLFIAFFKKFFSNDYMTFVSALYFIFILFLDKTIKSNTKYKLLALFFFISLGYFGLSLNIMRQMIGLVIIYYFFPYILQGKKSVYYIVAVLLVSISIHISLILLLLLLSFPLISNYLNRKGIVIILLASFSVALFQIDIQSLIITILNATPFLAVPKFMGYLGREASFEFSILSYFFHTFFLILFLYTIPSVKDLYLYSFFLGVVFLNLLGNIDPVFDRVAEIFLFCRIFLFSNLWFNIEGKTKKYIFKFGVVFYSMFLLINSLMKNYGEIVPYINRLF
jgi:hypothetical protein